MKKLNATKTQPHNKHTYTTKDRRSSNTPKSNHLVYKESILSGGITNFTKGKFDIQAGLRAEYINYNATSLTLKQHQQRQLSVTFPSFSVNEPRKINLNSRSRRIQRPRYLYLNPYYEYIDTYNVSVGNPKLTAIH
jgi:hypothetical protein